MDCQPVDKQINYVEVLLDELGPIGIGIHVGVNSLAAKQSEPLAVGPCSSWTPMTYILYR